jgi:hypothetical protein
MVDLSANTMKSHPIAKGVVVAVMVVTAAAVLAAIVMKTKLAAVVSV